MSGAIREGGARAEAEVLCLLASLDSVDRDLRCARASKHSLGERASSDASRGGGGEDHASDHAGDHASDHAGDHASDHAGAHRAVERALQAPPLRASRYAAAHDELLARLEQATLRTAHAQLERDEHFLSARQLHASNKALRAELERSLRGSRRSGGRVARSSRVD